MAVTYRDPFAQLQSELDRMLETAFGPVGATVSGVYPPVNVFDRGEVFVVKAELPGVEPAEVQLDVEESTLTLRGERAVSEPTGDGAYHRREREQGRFRRVVRMPGRIAGDEARAEYRNGVLSITIPKAPEARPRRLSIQPG
jgi:HSP20 family protein